ncbi:maleylpyruvate isomerase family mycothiol-dependent enzyme [Segeticoccus rhizosphaerae]|jgi:uncharacterized protein (TIGR03083 family)|uniref:maleylpyruvate isomerase family mycothiol-dependent enzyme n=1 Tax=Segeticoccus rhizosphaerae TaxID=1104777 RepID=UPI0010BF6B7C|nr:MULTISPECIES: maleylpyruvate isomerase family mycothiol-dependent enzyme [Intrasporangiaceae]
MPTEDPQTVPGNQLDYLDHLSRNSARFREALHDADPTARVPTCPDWDADDLWWHLGEVQWFWSQVVGGPLTDGDEVEALQHPTRPTDRAGLEQFHLESSRALQRALAETPPSTRAWTWSEEQTAGFSRRRQAHESLIHRLDAELTAGTRTDLDPALAADGVDEVLRIMYGGHPGWGRFVPEEGATIRLRTTDTGDSWLVTLGRFVGHDPGSDEDRDDPDIGIAASDTGEPALAALSGTAADLDCWLWHRPPVGEITREGDSGVIGRFEQIVSADID